MLVKASTVSRDRIFEFVAGQAIFVVSDAKLHSTGKIIAFLLRNPMWLNGSLRY